MFWTIILFREPGFCFLDNLLDVSTLSLIRPAPLPTQKLPLVDMLVVVLKMCQSGY